MRNHKVQVFGVFMILMSYYWPVSAGSAEQKVQVSERESRIISLTATEEVCSEIRTCSILSDGPVRQVTLTPLCTSAAGENVFDVKPGLRAEIRIGSSMPQKLVLRLLRKDRAVAKAYASANSDGISLTYAPKARDEITVMCDRGW